jgi:hypothetical protein
LTDNLLNDTWAEGAMLIDADTKILKFYGGQNIERKPYLRRPTLRAVRSLWPMWSVEWAHFGIVDLAVAIGWEAERVMDGDYADTSVLEGSDPLIGERDVHTLLNAEHASELITVQSAAGEVCDYAVGAAAHSAITLGPPLLNRLRTQPTISFLQGRVDAVETRGAYIDEAAKVI